MRTKSAASSQKLSLKENVNEAINEDIKSKSQFLSRDKNKQAKQFFNLLNLPIKKQLVDKQQSVSSSPLSQMDSISDLLRYKMKQPKQTGHPKNSVAQTKKTPSQSTDKEKNLSETILLPDIAENIRIQPLLEAQETEIVESKDNAPVEDKIEKLSQMATELASKILVSQNRSIGSEVRIILNDKILPQTELVLRRNHGEIQINFNIANADSLNFLNSQRTSLAENLTMKLGETVTIEVNKQGSQENQDANDGRSRNKYYYPYDEE